jgi:hypothetical protein
LLSLHKNAPTYIQGLPVALAKAGGLAPSFVVTPEGGYNPIGSPESGGEILSDYERI